MRPESPSIRKWPKWVIFASFLITMPVPYYMVVIGGLVPMWFILFIAVQGLLVALPKFTLEGFFMLGIMWAHVVILGGFLYLAAHSICWVLFRVLPTRYALIVLSGLIAVLIVASSLEIYRLPGHNSAPPANILRVIRELAN